MASLRPKKVIAICQMTAKADKKSNINTCLEMIKAAKVQNAEVSISPSNNILCLCVKHNAVCDHSSHDSINFSEQLCCVFCVLLEAVVAISPTGLLRNTLQFLCVPDSIKLDVCKICLQKINILHSHSIITLLSTSGLSSLLYATTVSRSELHNIIFHCFTIHFNSLYLIHQLMHFYIQ